MLQVSSHLREQGCFAEWLCHYWKVEDGRKHGTYCLVFQVMFENSHRPVCLLCLLLTSVAGEYLFRKFHFIFFNLNFIYAPIIENVLVKAKSRQ